MIGPIMALLVLMISLLLLSVATTFVVREIRRERAKLRVGAPSPGDADERLPTMYAS